MGDTKFTLIELHLDGENQFGLGSIGTALPFGTADEETETSEYETETDVDLEDAEGDDEDSSSKALGAIVTLVVLVAIAAAAKKFRGGDEEDLETTDEPDVVVN